MSDPAPTPPLSPLDSPQVSSLLVMLGVTVAFAALLVLHNLRLFSEPIYEDGDVAVNSLLVFKAKRLELLHGHYSRLGFYHPGPALLYVLAGAEWLFHDLTGLVPAPHNAHILGQLLLYAGLLGVSVAVIARAANSGLAGAAVGLVFLVYFAREGHLSSHWFAYLFFMLYLSFQVAAALVASGRTAHLGWMALTAGLTVHSHVCFAVFVVPISLYALIRLWAKGGYRLRSLPASERRAWAVFAGVVALFVLPIALHIALHYPGEIGRYLHFAKQPKSGDSTLNAVGTFLIRTFTHESSLGWPLIVGAILGALVSVVSFRDTVRPFARQLGTVAALSSAVMVYYTVRGVDDLQQTYIGIFFGSVLLLCWTLIGLRVAALLNRGPMWRGLALTVGAGVAGWSALTGSFTNGYRGMPEAPALADAICADPRWEGGPPAITLHPDCWSQTATLLVQMERRGKRAWVAERAWDVLFTDQFRLNGRPVATLWQIDVAPSGEPTDGVRRVLGEFDHASFREVDTRCPLGQAIRLGRWERLPGPKPTTGWFGTGAVDYLMPVRGEAALLVDVGNVPASQVRLTISAQAIAPGSATSEQRVGVVVNGESVGEVAFGGARIEERSLVFAGELLSRHSPAQISFQFPDARGYRTRRNPGVVEKYSIQLSGLMLAPVGR